MQTKLFAYSFNLIIELVMNTYLVLLRGINVGGKNILSMAALKKSLEEMGFTGVSTYIASGNVILNSELKPEKVQSLIEEALPGHFKLDSDLIKVLVLTSKNLQAVIDNKPAGFGEEPVKYHSDAIFLMGVSSVDAIKIFNPREGVDKVWAGDGVIYSQRLSAERTKSRLSKIMSSPVYKSMTIRSWNTVQNLAAFMNRGLS